MLAINDPFMPTTLTQVSMRSCSHTCGQLRKLGFTMTEVLTIVAVASVLLAVGLTAVGNLRSRSRLSLCTGNLGQVSRAVLQYTADHDRRLPDTAGSPAPGGWWWYKEYVKPYAGLTGPSSVYDRVFGCPEDRGYGDGSGEARPFRKSARHDFTSYVFNGVDLPGVPNVSGRELGGIRNPHRTLLVMEWPAHAPLSWHRSLTGRANAPFYDGAESVVGFVDGNVGLIKFHYDGMNPAYTRDPIAGYAYKFSGD